VHHVGNVSTAAADKVSVASLALLCCCAVQVAAQMALRAARQYLLAMYEQQLLTVFRSCFLLLCFVQVAAQMALNPEQQGAISAAFQVYESVRRPVVQQLHQLAGQLHSKLGLLSTAQGGWAPGVYDLTTANEADGLLQQMSRCTRQLRELSLRLVW
jgi:hypothetical protein